MTGLLLVGAGALVVGLLVGAVVTLARDRMRRARRRRALGGRSPLVFVPRARLSLWSCEACGLKFLPNGPMPSDCPNPRCRAPWVWSRPSWPGGRFDA